MLALGCASYHPKRVRRVSKLQIVSMVLGRYLLLPGYLNPWGSVSLLDSFKFLQHYKTTAAAFAKAGEELRRVQYTYDLKSKLR